MSLANQVVESFNNAAGVTLSRGMIVRETTGVRQTLLAQADTLAHLASVIGVANNGTGPAGLYFAAVAGEVEVLLETGLTPVGAQIVYVSASVAGRGTTAAPTLAVPIGVITDASQYSNTGRVTISLFAFFAASGTGPSPNWDPTLVRYFFIDNENGNDANVGYIDAAPLTTFTPAQTSPVALKTAEELRKRIPRYGNSLLLVALFKPRSDNGNYVNKAGTNDYIDVGYNGYAYIAFRGSDLTNSTNDHSDLGGVVASAGPNPDSSWTATGQAAYTITNGAGVLATQDTIAGLKVQYKGNITGALRPIGNMVCARGSNIQLDVGLGVAAVGGVVNGDQYFLMTPGVKFTTIVSPFTGNVDGPNNGNGQFPLCGMRFTSTVPHSAICCSLFFVRFDATTVISPGGEVSSGFAYYMEDSTNVAFNGTGIDARSGFNAYPVQANFSQSMGAFHGSVEFDFGGSKLLLLNSGYSLQAPVIKNINGGFGSSIDSTIGAQFAVGASITRPTKLVAGLDLHSYTGLVLSIDVDASVDGIIVGTGSFVGIGDPGGSGARPQGTVTTSAISLVAAKWSQIIVYDNAMVGTTQDILLVGGVKATFASLATAAQMDGVYNRVQGSGTDLLRSSFLKFSGSHAGGAGAVVSYLADPGQVAAGALATPQDYPVQASCRLRNLIVKASANTLAANLVVEVYVGGVASGLKVTITPGSTATFNNQADEALVTVGTVIDLRLDSSAAGGGNTALLSATVECY